MFGLGSGARAAKGHAQARVLAITTTLLLALSLGFAGVPTLLWAEESNNQNSSVSLADETTSYTISKVEISSSSNLVKVGDTLTPTAYYLSTSSGDKYAYDDVIPAASVSYTWFKSSDSSGTNPTQLSGVDSAGNLTLTSDLQGSYVFVKATSGTNAKTSAPELVESSDVKELSVTVKVTGLAEEKGSDGKSITEVWVPLTEYNWKSDGDKVFAWDAFRTVLDGVDCSYSYVSGFLTSITTPANRTLENTTTAPWSYWSFTVNGEYASVGVGSYALTDGDALELVYIDGSGSTTPTSDVTVNPNAAHPELSVTWNGFKNASAGALTSSSTPIGKTNAEWATSLLSSNERADGMTVSLSDPLIIDDKVYIVSGSTNWSTITNNARLNIVNRSTGTVEKTVELATTMDTTCRPVSANGIILIPLSGGYVQAVSASTLETIWVADAVSSDSQSLSTLTVSDGYVYIATVDVQGGSGQASKEGTIRRLNVETGALAGTYKNEECGYYWAGGVSTQGFYLVADDSGSVVTFSADLKDVISTTKISSSYIRTSLVESDGFLYVVSSDGVLHKLSVAADGEVSEVGSTAATNYSTSTPTISGGYAFFGGQTADYKGELCVVNLSDMSVQTITTADGETFGGNIQSTPLVSTRDGQTYVYFTVNYAASTGNWPDVTYTSGGGVYLYKLGDKEAIELFAPEEGQIQYCMASVIADAEGNIYYTNDSGHLFKIAAQPSSDTKEDTGKETTDTTSTTTTTDATKAKVQILPATGDDTTAASVALISLGAVVGVSGVALRRRGARV